MTEPKIAQRFPYVKDEQPGEKWWCACGHSKNQPYCDGSHSAAKFSDKRMRAPGTAKEFVGKDVTVVDDFSLCAHAGECVDGAPATFFTKGADGRISNPDATSAEQVMAGTLSRAMVES